MIIFLDLNGQIVESDLTERIGRNSTDVNKIYIVSKLAPETLFYFYFRLPNGVNLFGNLAALVNGESAGDTPDPAVRIGEAEGFNVWAYSLKEDVTRYAGLVEFSLYGILEGGARTATSGSFAVSVGVRPTVPSDPSGSEWDTILALLAANAADIAALGDRMTAAEGGISANAASIAENRESINALGGRMTAAEEDIADNAADIAANAASINRIETALTAQEDLNRSVERRLNNIEIGTLDTVEQSGEAYAVNVPDALPWVSVDKIGGYTYTEIESVGATKESLVDTTISEGVNVQGGVLNVTGSPNGVITLPTLVANDQIGDEAEAVITVLGGSYSGGAPSIRFNDATSAGALLSFPLPNRAGSYVMTVDTSSIAGSSTLLNTAFIFADGVSFSGYRAEIKLVEGASSATKKTPVTAVKTVGKNLLPESVRSIDGWNETTASGGGKRYNFPLDLPVGTYTINTQADKIASGATFSLQRSLGGGDYQTSKVLMQASNTRDVPYTFTVDESEKYRFYLSYAPSLVPIIEGGLQLEGGDTATPYAPYTETTYPITEAVQALDGYGDGLSASVCNYLDPVGRRFVKAVGRRAYQEGDYSDPDVLTNGVDTLYALSSPVVTDLGDDSPALTEDGFLEMEANGWIYLVNKSKSAVPYAITYQRTKGA